MSREPEAPELAPAAGRGTDAPWRLELFGGLVARRGEQVLSRFRTQKTALLLAYLAYHHPRTHPRDALIERLWPEGDPEAGRHKLSVALSWLRGALAPEGAPPVLLAERLVVGLFPGAVETDVAAFDAALAAAGAEPAAAARHLARAIELYRGPLLAGYDADWADAEQRHREEQFFRAAHRLIRCQAEAGNLEEALHTARRAVTADPLREESHQEVMRLYAALGQPAAAARQYQELERLLLQELGVAPDSATRRLRAALLSETRAEPGVSTGSLALADPAEAGAASARPCPEPSPGSPLQEGSARYNRRVQPPAAGAADAANAALPSIRASGSAARREPIGGAVALDSPFYVARAADAAFRAAIRQRESLVLVKGAGQTGKTSLLARGLQAAREGGARVVLTDFRSFNAMHWQSAEALLLALGEAIGEQLDLEVMPGDIWQPGRGPNPNFRRYLRREVLGPLSAPLVWGLDEVDRLFECDFGSEIFGMFRAWHNDRALDPTGPWSRLTLAIAYATEAHLFITDPNQSPFNLGTRLTLGEFTLEQVADLNARCGSPLRAPEAVACLHAWLGGHPLLVRLALDELSARNLDLAALEQEAEEVFGSHLRRLLALLARDPRLTEAMRAVLAGRGCPTPESFYRLRSAGLVTGPSERAARPRCELYARAFARRLPDG